MPPRSKAAYKELRNSYHPEKLKCAIVAESPPMSGNYFYDSAGAKSEPLYRAMMRDILRLAVIPNKPKGLQAFQREGYLLVDVTYAPVDGIKNDEERDRMILEDYRLLLGDLRDVMGKFQVPILLIKANVCRLLDERLQSDGFDVLNQGQVVPFPSSGQQGRFAAIIPTVLARIR